jgi:hypothetical protein
MCPFWLYLIPSSTLLAGGLALMIWLSPGPRAIGGVFLDIHTMLLGSLSILVGYQTLWLWAYSKIYGWTNGLLPAGGFSPRIFNYLNLERGLVAGSILLASGLGLNVWLVDEWHAQNFGSLDLRVTLRYALWGLTLMVIGVQTIYGSFFLSMLGMTESTKGDG